jgi:hypothetical protein
MQFIFLKPLQRVFLVHVTTRVLKHEPAALQTAVATTVTTKMDPPAQQTSWCFLAQKHLRDSSEENLFPFVDRRSDLLSKQTLNEDLIQKSMITTVVMFLEF